MRLGCSEMAAEMIAVKLLAEIPKTALKMVQNGQAEITSHFIRTVQDKSILNNFRIVGMDPSSPGKEASKILANPLRKVALRTGVTPSSLNLIKANTDKILSSLNSLSSIQAMQWVNLGATLVNTAITAVGFYLTLKKMDSIEGEIRNFFSRYQSDRTDDMLESYETHLHNLMGDLDYLQKRYQNKSLDDQYFKARSRDIEAECNQTVAFLKKVLKEFQDGSVDQALGCQILFTLTPVLAEVITEYCWQYNAEIGGKHSQLEYGLDTLRQINSESFRRFMKHEMTFNPYYLAVSPEKRQEAQFVSFNCLSELEDNLKACSEAIQAAPSHELIPFDEFLDSKVWDSVARLNEAETHIPEEEFLKKQIMQMNLDESEGETVYIPLQMSGGY